MEIRGRAEVVLNKSPLENLKLETTPTVTRRWVTSQERTPGSDTTPGILSLREITFYRIYYYKRYLVW